MDGNNLKSKLLEKSQEAFILGIEIYNKPTIKYRVEGFSFFICNAWELMLKARMVDKNGNSSIYYKDNPERTITLENCMSKIFTNNKDPLRLNLERIIDLRNTSTHFITEEYEQLYIPLFQSCVFNYINKLEEFFEVDITKKISQNFLNLSVNYAPLLEETIKAKYSPEIADKIIATGNIIENESRVNNQNYSVSIIHQHYITKNPKLATAKVSISRDAENAMFIIKDLKDPSETHKYTAKEVENQVNKKLEKSGVKFKTLNDKQNVFNNHHFNLFVRFYGIKANSVYCYPFPYGAQTIYKYSMALIDFIVNEIKKDPENIIQNLKNKQKK